MWLPSRIYEALPATYSAAALGGILVTNGHPLSLLSAVLLLGAALWTWLMRRDYRGFWGEPGDPNQPSATKRSRGRHERTRVGSRR